MSAGHVTFDVPPSDHGTASRPDSRGSVDSAFLALCGVLLVPPGHLAIPSVPGVPGLLVWLSRLLALNS